MPSQPIPPRGQLTVRADVRAVRLGFDVVVQVRGLGVEETCTTEEEQLLLAWMFLAKDLQDSFDLAALLKDLPDGEVLGP